jgi:hypothetical protein
VLTGFLFAARAFLAKIPREVWYALAAALALWLAYDWAYDRGAAAERVTWEAEAARLRAVAAEEAAARAAAVDAATRGDAARISEMTRAMTRLQQKVTAYAQSQNGLSCGLDAAGGMLINEAVAAANAAAAPGPRPR